MQLQSLSKLCTLGNHHHENFLFSTAHSCQKPNPPSHGQMECYESKEGLHCSVTCNDGYAFVMDPPKEYFCADDNKWIPADKLPIPDCAGIVKEKYM